MKNTTTSIRLGFAAIACCALHFLGAATSAQVGAGATELAESFTDALIAEDAEALSRTRARLAERLEDGATVQERIEISQIIIPGVRSALRGDNVHASAVALSMAGRVATRQTAQVLETGLEDDSPAVRIAAAHGYQVLMRVVTSGSLALSERDIDGVLRTLEDALASAVDGREAQALAMALGAAGRNDEVPGFDLRAGTALARSAAKAVAMARAAGSSDGDWDAFCALVAGRLQSSVLDAALVSGGQDRDLLIEAGRACGQILAHARDRVRAGELDDTPMRMLALASKTSETVLGLTSSRLGIAGAPGEEDLQSLLIDGDESAYFEVIDAWIGEGGALTRGAFGFDHADFAPAG